MTSTRSLTADEAERVRVPLRLIVEELRGQVPAAEALGVSQSAVSESVKDGARMGPKTARAVAKYIDVPFEDLLSGAVTNPTRQLQYLPGFAEALAEAKRAMPSMADDLDQLATERTPRVGVRVTPGFLITLAAAWAQAQKKE